MLRILIIFAILSLISSIIVGCNSLQSEPQSEILSIHLEPSTQRYSISARNVPRGTLLDQLKRLTQVEVRPSPDRSVLVTADAKDLDIPSLVALLMPEGSRYVIRYGARDLAAAPYTGELSKTGKPEHATKGLVAKPEALRERPVEPLPKGVLKAAPNSQQVPREVVHGPDIKPPAKTLAEVLFTSEPKKPSPTHLEHTTVRLTLQFSEGSAPKILSIQTIEGRAPMQRFVTGSYLYAVLGPDGRVLESGTFQDPLVERSYQPEGPHSVLRTRTGVVGISILREHLAGARLQIVDMTGRPMPRELNDDVVRGALRTGKATLELNSRDILRRIDLEKQ